MLETPLKDFIRLLPEKPGVYRYFDAERKLLYIGKAKNLKKRVSSYFNKDHDNHRIRLMVSKIKEIEFTLVDTEMDALLLENLLIKEHQPRYNINLKDDKTYPFIKITKEDFPRIYPTRQYVRDGSEYFGPYASVGLMHTLLDLVKSIYPVRSCNLPLTQKNVTQGKFQICLEYQIGNCRGPCAALQTMEDYQLTIQSIRKILKGRLIEVMDSLNESMKHHASRLEFEQAHQIKLKYERLSDYQGKSTIVSQQVGNVDVFSIAMEEQFAFVNFMRVVNGMVIQTQTLEIRLRLKETPEEVLTSAIAEFQNRYGMTHREWVVPFDIALDEHHQVKITVPKSGEKKKLLELSLKNVLYFKREKLNQYEKTNPELRTERLMEKMKQDLKLQQWPKRIECFDNSNLQGTFPVSAMVCFLDGRPAKKEYRHFKVKTVEGPDDFSTMHEVITRRYSRVMAEQLPLPDLIVVDGGKGQLSSAVDALMQLGLWGKIPILGIAKRLEELYYPGDEVPLHLDKKSETLKVIQNMRDEAHRFGITFHRKLRGKGALSHELENIPGIGNDTATKALSHFGSVKRLRETSMEDLATVIGKSKAQLIYHHFHESDIQS